MNDEKVTLPNPKNEDIKIFINGEILPRNEAKISVFDSVVQGGDAVWEGLRLYEGKIFMLEAHLTRLMNSAKVLAYEGVPSKNEIRTALKEVLQANDMHNDVHMNEYPLSKGLKDRPRL